MTHLPDPLLCLRRTPAFFLRICLRAAASYPALGALAWAASRRRLPELGLGSRTLALLCAADAGTKAVNRGGEMRHWYGKESAGGCAGSQEVPACLGFPQGVFAQTQPFGGTGSCLYSGSILGEKRLAKCNCAASASGFLCPLDSLSPWCWMPLG